MRLFNPYFFKYVPANHRDPELNAAYKVGIGNELGYTCQKIQLLYNGKIQPRTVPSFIFIDEELSSDKADFKRISEAMEDVWEKYLDTPADLRDKVKDIDLTKNKIKKQLGKDYYPEKS
ncbi:hypothetical protein [Liquorilactobacillus uvarum]|uniref:Uncharacterized protein n=1 Tax=Liquorilactobacillus uvarum DSM 19971 TaxID=1423812 RepID=A0A0R1QD59_9LACO|nr:hypothetical protein [Liquorilactobacillus uvarum]KRL38987.1 hypothetical protein FD20_GL000023 [Liquorilactobacillus uvarum DSM 19971]